jgi:DNA gyrase subunit B
MSKNKTYTADDIQILTDREHVRLRTAIYLGNVHPSGYVIPLLTETNLVTKYVEFVPAVYKAIGEVVDNALDEFAQITSKNKVLKLTADPEKGLYVVSDNGRGIPIDTKMEAIGKTQKEVYIPELALSRLRAGRNFTDDKEIGVIGQNGVGSACTNFCSSSFEVIVTRDNKKYYQKFTDGANVISKPKIIEAINTPSGTAVKFQLDKTVFKNISLPEELMRNRAIEIAMTNPDITVEYNKETFKYKNGFKDFINQIAKDKTHYRIDINEGNIQGQIFVIFDAHDGQDEQMFTWVNSSLMFCLIKQ